jgi:ribosomal protein S3
MNWEQETIQEMLEDKLNKQQLSNIDLERIMFQIM